MKLHMKEYRSYRKHLALAIAVVAIAAVLIVRWDGSYRWHTGTPGGRRGNSFRPIAMQLPGTVVREGDGGAKTQPLAANCAQGFVRRGSVCEAQGTAGTTVSTAASTRPGQFAMHPPERE